MRTLSAASSAPLIRPERVDDERNEKPVLKAAVPVLAVEDLREALAYYANVLGFQVGWTWGDPPHLASVYRNKVELIQVRRGGPVRMAPRSV